MRKSIYLFFALTLVLSNCSEKEEAPLLNIDPSDAAAMANEITFTPSTTKVNGLPPAPSTSPNAPTITYASSASVVAAGTVYIPITYTSTVAPSSLLVQVVGANAFYFSIPLAGVGANGTVTIPMSISSRVLTGNFSMAACVLSGTDLSEPVYINATVTEPLACGDGMVSGSEGVTTTRHQLGGTSGNVTITYDTYSVPDRIDVFLDGTQWKGGTGTTISPPPPTSNCSTPLPGFVGAAGTITVPVSTTNKYIDVYVSGCLGSGTAWDYTLTCPL
jgi:hypothetical protein